MLDHDFRAAVGCAVFGAVGVAVYLLAAVRCRGGSCARLLCLALANVFSFITVTALKDAVRERPEPVAPTAPAEVKQ